MGAVFIPDMAFFDQERSAGDDFGFAFKVDGRGGLAYHWDRHSPNPRPRRGVLPSQVRHARCATRPTVRSQSPRHPPRLPQPRAAPGRLHRRCSHDARQRTCPAPA